ncbi:CinA family protein [Sphingobacterium sp. SYP-B4668]|uniref:CinA family protein n=1 Tax=Sphingobacterium sp. SYP-B4668 TaxID=2996035 RepID=UPI0022DD150D|nr:CinA family protein [Sphingobacterium sp. SYP-B4668]
MEINSEKLNLCGEYFSKNELKLVLAESMTAGFVASVISLEQHAGDYFLGSVVCYHDEMKKQALQIDADLLDKYGGVSAEVTAALVKGLQRVYRPDIAIAITGFASACGETTDKNPVGTVFINMQFENFGFSKKCLFKGLPEEIIKATTNEIIENLYETIQVFQTVQKCKL